MTDLKSALKAIERDYYSRDPHRLQTAILFMMLGKLDNLENALDRVKYELLALNTKIRKRRTKRK